jgi:hypothetical protein
VRRLLAALSPTWIAVPVLVCAAALVGGWVGLGLLQGPRAEVVGESPTGWKTIEYDGVRVDIPAAWERADMGGCEFEFELWAPPESDDCGFGDGVAFYGSATFDPSRRPGLWREEDADDPRWVGYTYAGEFAVNVSAPDRALARRVLASAR